MTIGDSNALVTVSCPATNLCVAIDSGGNAVISTNPTGGATAWTTTDIDGSTGATDISCPTIHLCVAVDGSGNAIVSTNPSGGASAWTKTEIDTTFYNTLYGVSCPSALLCVAVDTSGNVVTSTNPTGGASAWVMTAGADPEPPGGNPDANSLGTISCPTTSLCVAGDFNGNLLTTTNPTGPASAWTLTSLEPTSDIGTVSCASADLCLATSHGDVWSSTTPTAGASAWTKTFFQIPFDALTCPTSALCVGEDVATDVVYTTHPTGAATAWKTYSVAQTSNHLDGGVSCASARLCVVVGQDEVITSTNP